METCVCVCVCVCTYVHRDFNYSGFSLYRHLWDQPKMSLYPKWQYNKTNLFNKWQIGTFTFDVITRNDGISRWRYNKKLQWFLIIPTPSGTDQKCSWCQSCCLSLYYCQILNQVKWCVMAVWLRHWARYLKVVGSNPDRGKKFELII